MAYEIKVNKNVLGVAVAGQYVTIAGSLANTGLTADADGRKIVPAGTPLKPASTTIMAGRDTAVACGAGDGPLAEVLLQSAVDVTDGTQPATFIIKGIINGESLPALPSGTSTKLFGGRFRIRGAVTENPPPVLTFVCADHATDGKTKITAVSPTLTEGNSYMVKVTSTIPEVGKDMTGATGWAAYTLGDAITATNDAVVTLIEVSTGDIVVKAGQADAVVTPILTFTCEDATTAGATKVSTINPAATGENTYMVKVGDITLPNTGDDLTGVAGWAAYTLGEDITATNGQKVNIAEVSTGDIVVKAGTAVAVVA